MSSGNTGSGLGIILGILGLVALASYFSKKKCLRCGYENPPEAFSCISCGEVLK